MDKTEIAVILPEFEDPGNTQTSSVWKTNYLPNDDEIKQMLSSLDEFINFFKSENCDIIYDSKNAYAFTFIFRELPDVYPSRERHLKKILKSYEDWRRNSSSKPEEEYRVYFEDIKNETRTEIASRKRLMPNSRYLIAFHKPDFDVTKYDLSKEGQTTQVEVYPMNVKSVFGWLCGNRVPPRKYNWNEKHGEYGKGAHKDNKGDIVSVLLCSREHAGDIMNGALSSNKQQDYLYCNDEEFGHYMEYKADCKYEKLGDDAKVRTYHSYHIDDSTKIPKDVLKKMEILAK